jgi:hypothetical protein
MPNKQVRQFLSKTEFGKYLLGIFPFFSKIFPLQESIRDELGGGNETFSLVVVTSHPVPGMVVAVVVEEIVLEGESLW